jgi:hypothetical protein
VDFHLKFVPRMEGNREILVKIEARIMTGMAEAKESSINMKGNQVDCLKLRRKFASESESI